MKKRILKKPVLNKKKHAFRIRTSLLLALTAAALSAFPSLAANIRGEITDVNSQTVSGWAWNPEDTNDVQKVEVHICQSGNPEPIKYLHVTADDYREDLVAQLKDGWHGFSVAVDWSQLKGTEFKIKAYAVKDDNYYTLGETVSYRKTSGQDAGSSSRSAAQNAAPSTASAASSAASASSSAEQGSVSTSGSERSLGIFTTSGYCNCEACCHGQGLTYSGAAPQANHTISADLSLLPIGSKVRIGNTVYTVEDTGSSIIGNWIDIYYDSHDSAMAHGLQQQEVFLIL